jgi:ElaB/YqjD/DUF883 family membrane-anchored ribosome-binding protein
MAKPTPHRAELDELAAEVKRPSAPPAPPAHRRHDAATANATGDHPGREGAVEIERLVRELESKLSDAAADAEAIVAAHPLAVVASAFLLGIAIGRMMGRR